jgi:competence protein ComEC
VSAATEGSGLVNQGRAGRSRALTRAMVQARVHLAWLRHALETEQDRWFYWLPVLFGLGIGIYFLLPAEPRLMAALAPSIAALALRFVWRRGVLAVIVGGALVATSMGIAAAKLRSEWVRAPVLTRQIGPVDVRGFVELVEPRPGRGQRLTLAVTTLGALEAHERPRRVRVRTLSALPGLKPGDAVRLRAILAPPAGPALPGGFDFARSAWFQSLGGVGYAMSRVALDPTAAPPPARLAAWAMIERIRQRIGAAVVSALPGETGAIANALITGERGGISEATNNAFRDSGLFHVLSISGLHMVIMAGAAFYAARFLLALVPWLALHIPIKKWAAVAAALTALGYLLISGTSSATVRSWIMISIMLLAVLLDRPAVAMRNVALAALAILAVSPESLHDVGFQMSFAAVAALVAAYEAIRDRMRSRDERERFGPVMRLLLFFGGIVLTTLIASLSVAPLAAYHFHKSQQFAILANLVAIPICNIIVMPAALAALVAMPFGLETLPLAAMGWGIEGMIWCANFVARLPGAVGWIPAMAQSGILVMLAGGLWLVIWRTRWRLLGLAPIATGLALAPTEPLPDLLIGGRDGSLVALRTEGRRLEALPVTGSQYEMARWLEHDGDSRSPREAMTGTAFRCDAAGCVARFKDRLVAVPKHPAALADDCARADILVLRWPRDAGCAAKGMVVDYVDLRRHGAHALYFSAAGLTLRTAAMVRGVRPWSPADPGPAQRASRLAISGRIALFAAPAGFLGRSGLRPRPEIEDEAFVGGPQGAADDE